MFEYEWGNPSTILFPPTGTADHNHDASNTTNFHHHHHHRQTPENTYSTGDITTFIPPTFLPLPNNNDVHYHHHHHPLMDPSAFPSASFPPAPPTMLSSSDFDPASAYFALPKPEPPGPVCINNNNINTGSDLEIGLNLGGRTYFSAADEDFLSRLYRRARPFDGGIGGSLVANSPKCQAEGCNADLSNGKHYHRRHKVCEFHSKASTVVAGGLTQRFCQQCSRFHLLTEFDNGKRSCRRRLADHNRRRRKSHQPTSTAAPDRRPPDNAGKSSSWSENPPSNTLTVTSPNYQGSPSESRAPSVSSSTMAASSPMQESKLGCYNSSAASPSVSPSSIFY